MNKEELKKWKKLSLGRWKIKRLMCHKPPLYLRDSSADDNFRQNRIRFLNPVVATRYLNLNPMEAR